MIQVIHQCETSELCLKGEHSLLRIKCTVFSKFLEAYFEIRFSLNNPVLNTRLPESVSLMFQTHTASRTVG